MLSTNNKKPQKIHNVAQRRAALFCLASLAACGLSLAYLNRPQSSPSSMARDQNSACEAFSPAIRISLTDAVIPAGVWKKISAQCRDDASTAKAVLASKDAEITRDNIAIGDRQMGTSRSVTPVRIQTDDANGATAMQFSNEIRSLSVTPQINSDRTISVVLMSTCHSPANLTYRPENCRSDQFSTRITLKNGEPKILRTTQSSPNTPVRIRFITALTFAPLQHTPLCPMAGRRIEHLRMPQLRHY